MEECETCKRFWNQGGNCQGGKRNCLIYEEEPRGKIIHSKFVVPYKYGLNQMIKSGEILEFEDGDRTFKAEVCGINYIDLATGRISINVQYYENDMPKAEKKKKFRIVK